MGLIMKYCNLKGKTDKFSILQSIIVPSQLLITPEVVNLLHTFHNKTVWNWTDSLTTIFISYHYCVERVISWHFSQGTLFIHWALQKVVRVESTTHHQLFNKELSHLQEFLAYLVSHNNVKFLKHFSYTHTPYYSCNTAFK